MLVWSPCLFVVGCYVRRGGMSVTRGRGFGRRLLVSAMKE